MPLQIAPTVRPTALTVLTEHQRCRASGCGRIAATWQPTLTIWTTPAPRVGPAHEVRLDLWFCDRCKPRMTLRRLVTLEVWRTIDDHARNTPPGLTLDATSMELSWRPHEVWPAMATKKGVQDA